MVKGVIEAERGAIEHYSRIVEVTDQIDPVTNDMVIAILHDEQGHLRLFEGFLREYEAEGIDLNNSAGCSPSAPLPDAGFGCVTGRQDVSACTATSSLAQAGGRPYPACPGSGGG